MKNQNLRYSEWQRFNNDSYIYVRTKFDNAQMLSSAVKLLCKHPVGDTRRTISVGVQVFVNKSTIVTNEHVSPINS